MDQPLSATSRVTVLMYHRVGDAANDLERRYCVSPERFAAHMHALRKHGMQACSLENFVAWLRGDRELVEGTFVLTFDDGFLGVYEHAFPLLERMRWPAVMFLVTGLIGKEDKWSREENPPRRAYQLLGKKEIAEMSERGFAFESHSRSHADLTTLDHAALSRELAGARQDLEDLLGKPVRYLAYPYGRFNDAVMQAAQASGYEGAFSTQPGFNRRGVDRLRMRRLDVSGSDSASALLRKVTYGGNHGSWWQPLRYYAERLRTRLGGISREASDTTIPR